jgi:hypothetical protein
LPWIPESPHSTSTGPWLKTNDKLKAKKNTVAKWDAVAALVSVEREISVQVDGMIPWIPAFDGLNVRVKWTPVEQGR